MHQLFIISCFQITVHCTLRKLCALCTLHFHSGLISTSNEYNWPFSWLNQVQFMMILLFIFQINFIAISNLTGFSLKAKLKKKWASWMAKWFRRISDWINWLFKRMIWHFRTDSASGTNHSDGHVFGFCTLYVVRVSHYFKNHFGPDISFQRNQFCKNDKRRRNHGKLNDFTRAEEKTNELK